MSQPKPKRKKMKIVLFILLGIAVVQAIGLLWLLSTIGNYKKFWEHKAQESGEITYLALGDSAAQGIGATSPMRGYVGLIAKQLATKTGKSVHIINLSVTGATVDDCLRDQIPKIKDVKADYVTIEIGANDVKHMKPAEFTSSFTKLANLLPDGAYVANMPLFNSRPGRTEPAKDQSMVIAEVLKNHPKLHLVDLQKQTTEHQSILGFAPDWFHPNNLSYKNWADAFWNEIEKDPIKKQ